MSQTPLDSRAIGRLITRALVRRLWRDSIFLYPNPQNHMDDPLGFLKEVVEGGLGCAPADIDWWCCEAQGIKP